MDYSNLTKAELLSKARKALRKNKKRKVAKILPIIEDILNKDFENSLSVSWENVARLWIAIDAVGPAKECLLKAEKLANMPQAWWCISELWSELGDDARAEYCDERADKADEL